MSSRTLRLALAASLAASLLAGLEGTAAGVRWQVPDGWSAQAERPMRIATYALPASRGSEPGECGVYFFGRGQGGGVAENVRRWSDQFEGSPAPATEEKTVGGLRVHRVEIAGTYLPPGGPAMQPQGRRTGYRLLGAIVEAPGGLVFFKCTGPSATVEAARPAFDRLIASLAKTATSV